MFEEEINDIEKLQGYYLLCTPVLQGDSVARCLQEESIPCKKLCDIVQTIEAISLFKWGYFLFSVQNVHPPDCFRITHLTEIYLSSLQILMAQDDF